MAQGRVPGGPVVTEPVSAQARRTLPDAAYAGLVALLLALAGGAWALTARRMEEMGPGGGMAGMDAAAGAGLGGLGSFCLTWLLMMAAMMVPSVAPRALDSARLADADRALPSLRRAVAIIGFLAGYLLGSRPGWWPTRSSMERVGPAGASP